MIIKIFH